MNRRYFFRSFAGAAGTVALAACASAKPPAPPPASAWQEDTPVPGQDTLLAADGNELRVATPTRFMPGDIIHFPGAMADACVVDSDLTVTVRWVNTTPGGQPAEGDTILRIGNAQMPIEVTQ